MIFQEALGEEDEYIRLQKISQGIKEVSIMLRNMQIISDSNILKSMICSYPFQQASIELLLSAFFDYFRNRLFLLAFYKALQEIAELQEYREFLGNRSTRNLKMNMNGNINKILEEQQKQGNIPFAKQVIEKLLIAKKFACSYLKRFFELAIELNANLEHMSTLFKQFIIHTRCQKFQSQLIEQFQDCKNSIFYEFSWKHKYDLELDEFCQQWNVEVTPKWILERKQSMSSFNYIPTTDKIIKTEQDEEYITPASKVESVADCVEIMQKIICKPIEMVNQHDLLQLHSSENIEILIKFIIHPMDEQLIDDWSLFYPKQEVLYEEDDKLFKEKNIQMDYFYTIRSFKSLQFLTQKINHSRFYHSLLDMTPKIFQSIKGNILNKTIQLNLNHLAMLLNQLLILCPKISINKIIELNFLFILVDHINNHQIQGLIIDILDINTDKYQLGLFILEQLWRYIKETNFLNCIYIKLFYNKSKQISIDDNAILKNKIQEQLKILSKFKDKAKAIEIMRMSSLDEFIGPLALQQNNTLNEEYIQYPENLSYTQLLEQDIDAIRAYLDERRTPLNRNQSRKQSRRIIDSINSSFRSQTIQHTRTTSSTLPILPTLTTPKSSSNKLSETQYSQESKIKRGSLEKLDKLEKTNNLKSQWGLAQLTTSRQSISSDNGFSSSKLIMLYPSANIKAHPSQFELDLQEFFYNNNENFQENLNLLEQITNIICLNENKRTSSENDFIQILFDQDLILNLTKIYLIEIQNKNKINIGIQCGKIVNMILKLADKNATFEQQENIRDIFYQIIEYLNKIIIQYYKQNQDQGLDVIITLTLFQTIKFGFNIFEPYDPTKLNRNIYKFMNESVVHLFVIQFFKSKQNSVYQFEFFQYIENLLKKAPAYLIQNILFNIGLISSLYNAYTTFYVNGFKSHSFNESLFYYITKIVQSIYQNLISREFNMIFSSLEPLDSWKCLIKSMPGFKQKDKKQKTQETEIPKSMIDMTLSTKQFSTNNDQRQSILLNLNQKKLSSKQSTPQKLSARISQTSNKIINSQSSTSLVF